MILAVGLHKVPWSVEGSPFAFELLVTLYGQRVQIHKTTFTPGQLATNLGSPKLLCFNNSLEWLSSKQQCAYDYCVIIAKEYKFEPTKGSDALDIIWERSKRGDFSQSFSPQSLKVQSICYLGKLTQVFGIQSFPCCSITYCLPGGWPLVSNPS